MKKKVERNQFRNSCELISNKIQFLLFKRNGHIVKCEKEGEEKILFIKKNSYRAKCIQQNKIINWCCKKLPSPRHTHIHRTKNRKQRKSLRNIYEWIHVTNCTLYFYRSIDFIGFSFLCKCYNIIWHVNTHTHTRKEKKNFFLFKMKIIFL